MNALKELQKSLILFVVNLEAEEKYKGDDDDDWSSWQRKILTQDRRHSPGKLC